MKTWVIGHSIVHWAADYARSQNCGHNLNIHPKVRFYWLAQRGMHWQSLMPMLRSAAATNGPPRVLIIHAGENDLVEQKGIALVLAARADLKSLHALYPSMTIGWSNLLPRLHWRGASNPSHLNYTVSKINRAMCNTMHQIGGFSIPYPTITSDGVDLFRGDGVHLTPLGNDFWLHDLRQALGDRIDCGV
ncbi:Hypothetical predicted protein [Podarcis lilfordi]|uniref:SGNH hydrolase-type esterase domain-containing protein n=1 Tax=Podarcis lilfordi TaxID=74358 RepID=A0AA35NVP9_9SAUR|nr:Hypothetical predicted protein [Podarcis lilfordi]